MNYNDSTDAYEDQQDKIDALVHTLKLCKSLAESRDGSSEADDIALRAIVDMIDITLSDTSD